jgi:hypothetical protein
VCVCVYCFHIKNNNNNNYTKRWNRLKSTFILLLVENHANSFLMNGFSLMSRGCGIETDYKFTNGCWNMAGTKDVGSAVIP